MTATLIVAILGLAVLIVWLNHRHEFAGRFKVTMKWDKVGDSWLSKDDRFVIDSYENYYELTDLRTGQTARGNNINHLQAEAEAMAARTPPQSQD